MNTPTQNLLPSTKESQETTTLPKKSYMRLLFISLLTLVIIFSLLFLLELLWFALIPPQKLTEKESEDRIEQIKESLAAQVTDDSDNSDLLDFDQSDTVLFIPRLNLNLGVFTGDETTLEKGIWNRYPERTSDENIVLTGHRFTIGNNIFGYQRKSPLIHIEALEAGDSIFLISKDYESEYKVIEGFKIGPKDSWIEENGKVSRLTLYSCTLAGADDGRYVVRAELAK